MKENIENIRIIFCGPPHSGKSVLLSTIYKNLPQSHTAIVRAAPDGEGMYSNNVNQEQIQATRRKGDFSEQRTQYNTNSIENEKASIVLVDVGGKINEDKEKIFDTCNYSIVLSNNIKDKETWIEFSKKHDVLPIAILDSALEGKDEIYSSSNNDVITGKITDLQRGKTKYTSPLINKILDKIQEITITKKNAQKEIKGAKYISDKDTINMLDIAKELDMIDKETNNAKWNVSKSCEIYSNLINRLKNKNEANFFEARANWVAGLCTQAAIDSNIKNIKFYDARQDKFIQSNKAELNIIQDSSKLENNTYLYNVLDDNKLNLITSKTDDSIFLGFEPNPNNKIVPEDFENMKFPDIDINKKLYISGKLPAWLFSSISLSYENQEKYILQPGNGFIKYASENKKELGTVEPEITGIDTNKILENYKEFFENEIKK